jgi:hypothetical protein
VVVGATPGGELGGTWASPTIDASHSGSTHAATQSAAEATAAAALTAHGAAADPHPTYLTAAEGNAAYMPLGPAGAPSNATYLVATADATLLNEIVVGATPGGELGGTWASPTVDAVHSGSAHLALGSTGSTAAAGDHTHAGGGASYMRLRTGVWYTFPGGGNAQNTATNGWLSASPIYIAQPVTVSNLAIVSVAGLAGSLARLGIYRDTNGQPDVLMVDGGTVDSSGVGAFGVTLSTVLTAGWYWLAVAAQGSAGLKCTSTVGGNAERGIGWGVPSTGPGGLYESAGVLNLGPISGALPSPWGATRVLHTTVPFVWIAFSAVT